MGGRGSSSGKAMSTRKGETKEDAQKRYEEKNKPKSRFAGWREREAQRQATKQEAESKRETQKIAKKESQNRYNTFSEKQAERLSKMPKTGEKVKSEFADFVKEQTGIDITKALSLYGNNRSNFSIDFRKLTAQKNENANMQALNKIKTLKSSNFNFNVVSNGAYTYLIGVENARYKK